ncbi:hypothetical protein AMATHDRAFT_61484 [Amanita thiersii Skay4041]|uniref:REJ domain-containing protein n=1 Tax=Amanita thiersii Skay4041 TaxID=703135 RepID=A0A2A9NLS4_9AGAR|nr:hypothetical protein AMATHDRAFT_61484 [Amanita thiersii Skay4041]
MSSGPSTSITSADTTTSLTSTTSTTDTTTSSPTTTTSQLPSSTTSLAPSTSTNTLPPTVTTRTSSIIPTSTSVYETTLIGTSGGSAYTTIVTQTTVIAPGGATASSSSNSGSTNVGAIVGGVVGGVGGLAALVLLAFLFLRWRRKNKLDDEFDGNFDPVRVGGASSGRDGGFGGTLPNIDINEEDDGMGGRLAASGLGIRGTVTPFTHDASQQPEMSEKARLAYAAQGHDSLSQVPSFPPAHSPSHSMGRPGPTSVSSEGGYAPTAGSSSVYGHYTQPHMQPYQQQQYPQVYGSSHSTSPGPTSTGAGSILGHGYNETIVSGPAAGGSSDARSAKEREAATERRPQVANPEGYGNNNSGIIVHQDGGRLNMTRQPEEVEVQQEIPPTYDSLPPDARRF